VHLSDGSWVDVTRGWWGGTDGLMVDLSAAMPWKHRRRRMYDRVVDDPRLSCRAQPDWPGWKRIEAMRNALEDYYEQLFSAPFLNFYRDGRDSVAFHADRELRELDDTLVAIVTLGSARPFLLRPRGGGRSINLRPASGDLLVMGGRCQLDWEHAVPKVARSGPRISVSMRWARRPS
jgi:alkylated DNA repair dioxygenase AlkB